MSHGSTIASIKMLSSPLGLLLVGLSKIKIHRFVFAKGCGGPLVEAFLLLDLVESFCWSGLVTATVTIAVLLIPGVWAGVTKLPSISGM